jgi:hypothetical protein
VRSWPTTARRSWPRCAPTACRTSRGSEWGSGREALEQWHAGRLGTKHLRRDPRCTLFEFSDRNRQEWLGLETTVTIVDGPDAPELNLRLYRVLAVEPDDVDEYLRAMVDEQRLIYEFEVGHTYGQV